MQISAQLLLSDRVEIEHILPFSATLDDSLNNRTVALREANRIKRNRTPWAAREDFEAQGWGYDGILQRAKRMPKSKRYRFAADGYERWLGEDKDFLARALNDTRYLSRVAAEYLRLVAPGSATRVIPGQMTAMLRAKFGLNNVLGIDGEKNRDDHRHHAVDACVIGVTDQGLMQRFARASAEAREGGLTRLVDDMPMPWPTYRAHVERAVNHIWVSHKPDHGYEGAMMEETSYGIRRDGSIKQRKKADGSAGREVSNLIRIAEPGQPQRHGVDAQGQPLAYKGYVGGSNYCMEITVDENGKWVGHVITTYEAYRVVREAGFERLRHPTKGQNGRPLAMRLVIGDCVRLTHDDRELTLRVVRMSAAGQVFMAHVNEANVDARNRTGELNYVSKRAGSFQKSRARLVGISPIGDVRDSGFKE
ncbi:CRISPR-associated endonuclease Cas9 [bioreactor metagenome]|uniref:CRISPR-associated endonuclease Cas9 n=1 Tax=bioreactor metagenome TaxID=1076179 RepID=A0A644ZAJ1_9ZZZZ